VDADLNPIPEDIDPANLPDKFHIVTNSVIYKYLDNPEYLARMEQLIPEIEAGEWCVSMECLFNGFDYAMINSKGEHAIIPRDESTAYLTKHLRSYGGTGKYQDYTVGRLLRNITFSGHGLVRNPANPESVIFNNVKNFSGSLATQVYFNSNLLKTKSEKSIMDGIDIKSLDAYAALKSQCEKLEAELAKYTSDAAKAELENLRNKASVDAGKIADLEKELSTAKDTITNLNTELTKSKDGASEYEKKYKDEVGKRTKAERTALLVKANAPADEIDGFLDQFGALADEQFAAIVDLAKSKWGGGQVNTQFEGGSVETPKPPIGKDESKADKKDKKKPPFMKDDDEDDTEASTFDNVEETEDKTTAAFENLESAQADIANELDSMMTAHRNRRNKK
jgi:hypothetical protein